MNRLRYVVSLALGCLLSWSGVALEDVPPYVVGNAFSLEDGQWLYSEYHRCDSLFRQCLVEYRDTEGQLLARKELDYSSSPHAPGIFLQDFVYDEQWRLESVSDPAQVVDAGFDNFVRSRWQGLAAGDTVTFPFQVLGRDEPLAMRAQRVECAEQVLCLEVALDAWLLRLVAPAIELEYDRASQRLLRYRGISNLRDVSGDTPMVDIRYDYQPPVPDPQAAEVTVDFNAQGQ